MHIAKFRHGQSDLRVGFRSVSFGFGSFGSRKFIPNRYLRGFRFGFGSVPTGSGFTNQKPAKKPVIFGSHPIPVPVRVQVFWVFFDSVP